MRGRFITFEGVEGCGKSTQMAHLRAWMEGAGLPVLATREPGGTKVGEGIRELLLIPRDEGLDAATELLLYEADRAQHVSEVIRPALEAGTHVLCDRFFDSTTAYQAFGRGLDEEMVLELNRLASGGLVPDLTLLFSVMLEEGLNRARGGSSGDRLEGESLAFHRRVQAGFMALANREPGRFCILGEGAIEQVHEEVVAIVKERFVWAGNPSAARTRP
ncbi:MAG: dTMP kinase [Nitrospinae bacterium]|nr:dTMP kinase [Nitrospinota bacterium]